MKRKLEEDTSEKQNPAKLIKALTIGGIAEAKRLIAETDNEEINAADENSWTASHIATSKDHKEVCELLSSVFPKAVNATDNDGWAALYIAAFIGHKEVCELLISMSPEAVNAVSEDGKTALHAAASGGHKETCKVLIENMRAKRVVTLLNQSSNDSHVQKVIGKIVVDFMNDKFLGSEVNPTDFTSYQIKLLKLYQVIDRGLLKSYLNEEKNHSSLISITDNYITKYYLTLIGVCNSVNKDSPMSMLVKNDCMSHMLSYLAPHSLCPELFAPIELSGEGEKANSENEDVWCSLA